MILFIQFDLIYMHTRILNVIARYFVEVCVVQTLTRGTLHRNDTFPLREEVLRVRCTYRDRKEWDRKNSSLWNIRDKNIRLAVRTKMTQNAQWDFRCLRLLSPSKKKKKLKHTMIHSNSVRITEISRIHPLPGQCCLATNLLIDRFVMITMCVSNHAYCHRCSSSCPHREKFFSPGSCDSCKISPRIKRAPTVCTEIFFSRSYRERSK